MKNIIKKIVPFELMRTSSWLSVAITLIIVGALGEIGKILIYAIGGLITKITPTTKDFFLWANSTNIQVSYFTLFSYVIIFIVLLFPIYRYLDRFLLNKFRREIIFEDDFDSTSKGWYLNYWGSTNPQKTNRIENSLMIFEANENELVDPKKEFGAYVDVRNGIYQGYTYEISCKVKSDIETTMGFQLWVHDTTGGISSVWEPSKFFSPQTSFREIKLKFIATSTGAIRVHLHNKAGKGRILVDNVSVVKV